MVKQFSLTKLMLALAITLQFSAVFADLLDVFRSKEAILEREKERCLNNKVCIERLKMLIVSESYEAFNATWFALASQIPLEEIQEEFEKNLQNDREERIKLLRQKLPVSKADIEHIERAESVYKETPAPSASELTCPIHTLISTVEKLLNNHN